MQHLEFAPERDERWPLVRDGAAVVALALAALCAVVLMLPSEGRVAAPLHQALVALLGQAAFVLPVALCVGGVLLLVRSVRPTLRLPRGRIVGLCVLAITVVAAEDRFAPNGGGIVGAWLSGQLEDLLGGPAAALVLLGGLLCGTLLTFHVRLRELARLRRRSADQPVKVSPWLFAVPRWHRLTIGQPRPSEPEDGRAAS
ncbi:MAG: DNA translocase FtsK 4TM domain-containing protein [Chloroflexi bacterium]|nr:DNA translocase FtsK 4TM domain-containing protein [Chloroflexota bacterium]